MALADDCCDDYNDDDGHAGNNNNVGNHNGNKTMTEDNGYTAAIQMVMMTKHLVICFHQKLHSATNKAIEN